MIRFLPPGPPFPGLGPWIGHNVSTPWADLTHCIQIIRPPTGHWHKYGSASVRGFPNRLYANSLEVAARVIMSPPPLPQLHRGAVPHIADLLPNHPHHFNHIIWDDSGRPNRSPPTRSGHSDTRSSRHDGAQGGRVQLCQYLGRQACVPRAFVELLAAVRLLLFFSRSDFLCYFGGTAAPPLPCKVERSVPHARRVNLRAVLQPD